MRLVGEPTFTPEHFFSLMDAETKELLIKQQPIDSPVSKVELVNGELYMFTGNGYKILDIETLAIKREVKLINRGNYVYHFFKNDKLIIGLWGTAISPEPGIDPAHYIVDLKTHSKLFQFYGSVYPSSEINGKLYLADNRLKSFDLNSGMCKLEIQLEYDATMCTSTFNHPNGKKYVVVSDIGFTYCFEAI